MSETTIGHGRQSRALTCPIAGAAPMAPIAAAQPPIWLMVPLGLDEVDLADRVAGPLAADVGVDGRSQVVVGAPAAQDGPQIGLLAPRTGSCGTGPRR